MGERKRWKDCKISRPLFGNSTNYPMSNDNDSAMNLHDTDPVLEKQRQYIKILEERNRLRKKLNTQRLQKDKEMIQREEAFTTTFNVPRKVCTENTAIAKKSKRHNRSAGSMQHKKELHPTSHNEAKSAPNSTFQPRGKWVKPAENAIATFETQKGKKGARFCFISPAQVEKHENVEKIASSEEEYLEDSFEEFNDESVGEIQSSDNLRSAHSERKVAIIEEMQNHESIASVENKDTGNETSPIPSDLFDMIKGLSISRQKMLQQFLTNFATSEQKDQDVEVLRHSVNRRDPELWKHVNYAFGSLGRENDVLEKLPDDAKASVVEMVVPNQYEGSREHREDETAIQFEDTLKNESAARRHSLLQNLAREEDEEAIHLREKSYKPTSLLQTRTLLQSQSESVFNTGDREPKRAVPLLSISASTPFLGKLSSFYAEGEQTFDFRVNILSSWNSTRAVGLYAIQIFDETNNALQVDFDRIRISDQMLLEDTAPALPRSLEMVRTVASLFPDCRQNLEYVNASERRGWKGRISEKSGGLQISFHVCSLHHPTLLRISNFKDHSVATRDIEVFFQKKCVWTGSLSEPNLNNENREDLCCEVSLATRSIRGEDQTSGVFSQAKTARLDIVREDKESTWAPRSARENSQKLLIPSLKIPDISKAETPKRLPAWLDKELLIENMPKKIVLEDESKRNREEPSTGVEQTRRVRRQGLSLRKEKEFQNGITSEVTRSNTAMRLSEGGLKDVVDSLKDFELIDRSKIIDRPRSQSREALHNFASSTSSASVLLDCVKNRHQDALSSANILCPPAPNVHQPIGFESRYRGKVLSLEIFSTWGDPHYVGLNGIEIFDEEGHTISDLIEVSACPSSINDLQEFHNDPRVPANIVDGNNYTCDDRHMWLAPFVGPIEEERKPNTVRLEMSQLHTISMVRIWNYNKSRAHSTRGVRHIRISLLSYDKADASKSSSRNIFQGDIRKAPGVMCPSELENCYEEIVFTKEKKVVETIRQRDKTWKTGEEDVAYVPVHPDDTAGSRPRTSQKKITSELESLQGIAPIRIPTTEKCIDEAKVLKNYGRPTTKAGSVGSESSKGYFGNSSQITAEINQADVLCGRHISIHLISTWGDRNYVGLTQIELLIGSQRVAYPLDIHHLDAKPRDLESIGHFGDPRTLDKVIDGVVHTTDDAHMWLVPYSLEALPTLSIHLPEIEPLFGLRIWNYNKSVDDSFRGVKEMRISIDGKWVETASHVKEHQGRRGCILARKAPGNAQVEFDQTICFHRFQDQQYSIMGAINDLKKGIDPSWLHPYKSPFIRQDYEPTYHPQGLILKIVCHTTWGDPYYLGLNGMEIYGPDGKIISSRPKLVTAKPYSVTEIQPEDDERDDRIPKNLFNGRNHTWEAQDAWLAPLASSLGKNSDTNMIYVVYDEPITISMVKIWNYSKTIERGVKVVSMYMDDLLIYFGTLKSAPSTGAPQMARHYSSKMPTKTKYQVADDFGQPIFFTTLKHIVEPEKRKVFYCGQDEQDVLCINDGQVMHASKEMHRHALDPSVEGITVDLALRPVTALRG